MDRNKKRTLTIGAREALVTLLALAGLGLAMFLFILGVRQLRGGGAVEAAAITLEPLLTATPTIPPTLAATAMPAAIPIWTPEPTPGSFEHVAQTGESLFSIAAMYGIELVDLLAANGMTESSSLSEGQVIVVPLPPTQAGTWHIVEPGETLTTIAEDYGVSPDAIRHANILSDLNAIYAGQRLRIPGVMPKEGEMPMPGPTPAPQEVPREGLSPAEVPTRAHASDWERSLFEGDLAANYPLTFEHPRFTLHYQPDTYVDRNLESTVLLTEQALAHVERTLNAPMEGTFDIYLAGTLFAPPNAHLRGWSWSAERKIYILHDGTGNDTDNLYFFVHELTHLVASNTWGRPRSTMLSEGLATYAGKSVLEGGGFLPYQELCTAIYAANLMPPLEDIERDWQAFRGHLQHPFNYFGSGCFVDHLISTRGLDAMRQLYTTLDYPGLYGALLQALDSEWRATLAAHTGQLNINPADMTAYTAEVANAYASIFANYNGTETMHQAYTTVDQARLALWQGNYAETRRWLDLTYEILGYRP